MSDRGILLLGAGVLAFVMLTRRRAAVAGPMVQRAPTINQMQDYWLKMAGIQLAGTGMQALARGAMTYKGGGTSGTSQYVDSSFDWTGDQSTVMSSQHDSSAWDSSAVDSSGESWFGGESVNWEGL